MGNGFQREIAINFPTVKEANAMSPYANPKKLGNILPVIERGVTFAICFINKGRYRPDLNPEYIDYDALKKILVQVNKDYKDKKIASTILGNSIFEGDGNKEKIIEIFNECCENIDITLYDYQQESIQDKQYKAWQKIKDSIGKVPKEEYYKMKQKYMWERNHGIYNPMPENFTWRKKFKTK